MTDFNHKQEQDKPVEQFNHKLASEQIASIYGVDVKGYKCVGLNVADQPMLNHIYITQDLGALMDLAIKNHIPVDYDYPKLATICEWVELKPVWKKDRIVEQYAAHADDPIEATRVAIAKALIKKASV